MGDNKNDVKRRDQKQGLETEDKIARYSASMSSKRAINFSELLGHEPASEAEKKLDFLYNSIHASLREASQRRFRNRGPALIFKMLTTGLSAVVTILLGIKVSQIYMEDMNNVALIISAFMTFIAGLSSFMDNHALWVLFTGVEERYKVLIKDIEYYTTGNNNIQMDYVDALKDRYQEALTQVAQRVSELRAEDNKNG